MMVKENAISGKTLAAIFPPARRHRLTPMDTMNIHRDPAIKGTLTAARI